MQQHWQPQRAPPWHQPWPPLPAMQQPIPAPGSDSGEEEESEESDDDWMAYEVNPMFRRRECGVEEDIWPTTRARCSTSRPASTRHHARRRRQQGHVAFADEVGINDPPSDLEVSKGHDLDDADSYGDASPRDGDEPKDQKELRLRQRSERKDRERRRRDELEAKNAATQQYQLLPISMITPPARELSTLRSE